MPLVSYLIWGMVGLGMASPYLLFGVIPGAVKLLPKPGDWMVTFKQLAGFAMLATAIFLLNAVKIGASEEAAQQKEVLIRALFLMLGLGFAGWAIGMKITVISEAHERWTWRGVAVLGLALFMWFPNLLFPKKLLDWQPFTEARLEELAAKGAPVLIDFTADWCANCRTNEALAIETADVAEFVRMNGVTPLYADYTNYSPEITKWIREFGSDGIPLTVIVGPGGLKDRIVLDGLFGKQRLLDALSQKIPAKK
jgi:thiol:disulfide interchange protein